MGALTNINNIENNNFENILKNVQYIQRSILNNTYKEQCGIIALLIVETITEIKETAISFDVPCVSGKGNSHLAVVTSRVKKAKASLIASLEELDGQLKRNKVNTKLCLVIIQKMLESNLYMDDVQDIIDNWKSSSRSEVIKRTINVK